MQQKNHICTCGDRRSGQQARRWRPSTSCLYMGCRHAGQQCGALWLSTYAEEEQFGLQVPHSALCRRTATCTSASEFWDPKQLTLHNLRRASAFCSRAGGLVFGGSGSSAAHSGGMPPSGMAYACNCGATPRSASFVIPASCTSSRVVLRFLTAASCISPRTMPKRLIDT